MSPTMWTEFLCCPSCKKVYNGTTQLPISIDCGHSVCKSCLQKLNHEDKPCPYDSKDKLTVAMLDYPVNTALLAVMSVHNPYSSSVQMLNCIEKAFSTTEERASLSECLRILQIFGQHLQPPKLAGGGSNSTTAYAKEISSCAYLNNAGVVVLSRPMQKKIISLISCQLATETGREKLGRSLKSLGERCITEMILLHQHPHQLSGNLWGAVRSRGCQFLGPAMQEEVIRLILTALADGSKLSRKVVVLYVVQRLHGKYPQASKTAIGHVVQLLYRASCFQVTKRPNESSLMQLKEEYCSYEPLRHEHDKQIVQIAHEAGLRIAPDQWSSLLYGDTLPYHKSRMQSIIDKLQTPQSFSQSIAEFLIALGRTNDPAKLSRLEYYLQQIAELTEPGSMTICVGQKCLESMKIVIDALTDFVRGNCQDKLNFEQIIHPKYKTLMCRDLKMKGTCPRGASCMFAHHQHDLEKHREDRAGDGVEEREVMRHSEVISPDMRYNPPPPPPQRHSKPKAIVSPNNKHYSGPSAGPRLPAQLPPGAYYYIGPSPDMPPVHTIVAPHQMPSPGYYQAPVAGGMMAGAPPIPPPVHPIHPAVHVIPGSPNQHGYSMPAAQPPPPQALVAAHGGIGGDGDVYLPVNQYYGQHPGYHSGYYSNRPPTQPPYHRLEYHSVAYDQAPRADPYMGGPRPVSDDAYYAAHHPHEHNSARQGNIHPPDQEQLYEYQANNATHQTLSVLRRRRTEIIDKIQSNQKPAEIPVDSIKTEISRDRIEDLAHSLAVSMNAGSQHANLQATFVNSMLSSTDRVTPATSLSVSAGGVPQQQCVHSSQDQWLLTANQSCASAEDDCSSRGSTNHSLGRMESSEYSSTSTLAYSDGADADDAPVWTSWSGLTSSVDSIMQDKEASWNKMKRSHSNVESGAAVKTSTKYSRSFSAKDGSSHSADSSEVVIPWSDSPYISKFGPIARSKGDLVNSRVEQLSNSSDSESHGELTRSSSGQISSLFADVDADAKSTQPIQVNSRNILTMAVTAVTPVRRPIPSPSLAHSKFKALPNDEHGFTITSADTEGTSSIAESVQLKQELRILNNKIDKMEAEVACDELADLERDIRRLEISQNQI